MPIICFILMFAVFIYEANWINLCLVYLLGLYAILYINIEIFK